MLALLNVLAAEAAEEATINPVVPDNVGEIFWGAISFFGLWILMRYVLLPPLMKVRDQRAQQVLADQEAAAAAEVQAEQVRRDYDATLAEARHQAAGILEEARVAAEARRAEAVRALETELAAERQAAVTELDAARAGALGELKGDVADLAVTAASKVVRSDVDPEAARATVDEYVNTVGESR